ncbi:hypothetical protein [Embleya sp. NPDC059259]|uniref:hypothetical protein n=1 Tax=unclassified Embleya TaxID=2699296 RepID=UPI00368A4889
MPAAAGVARRAGRAPGGSRVHGLAFLHLDGKLDASTPDLVADHVRTTVHALFTAIPATPRTPATPLKPATA